MRRVDDVLGDASRGLRELADLSPDPIILLDVAGVFRYVSPGVEPILGYPPDALVETHFTDLVVETTLGDAVDGFTRVTDGETVRKLELEVRDVEGDPVYVEVSATAVEGTSSEPYVYGIVREVTERKAYEQRLEGTNELLNELIDELPAGVLAETEGRTVALANQQLLELFDLPDAAEDIVGTDCRALASDLGDLFADPDRFADDIEARIDAGEPVDGERLDLVDGRVFERSYRVVEFAGETTHLWVYRDLTDQCERERDLRRFREAVEQAGTAIYITDSEGRIEYVNPAFERITGYTRAAAVGESPSLLNSGEHDERFFEDLWDTIQAGDVWEDTIVDQRRQGEQYVAIQTIAPITDADGTVVGYVAIQTDVTEQQLDRQRVTVLNRLLRHDLRNGLSIVMGNVERVQRLQPDDDEIQAACHISLERCERLLAKSRKARDLQELLSRDTATPRRLPAVLETLRERATAHPDIAFRVTTDTDSDVTVTDLVEAALVELVENACEHGASETVRLDVATTEGNGVRFSVSDDGPGLPEAERAVLERGEETPLEHSQGFGLWKAYWLVRAAGGTLSFADERAAGSVLVVQVPRAERSA